MVWSILLIILIYLPVVLFSTRTLDDFEYRIGQRRRERHKANTK